MVAAMDMTGNPSSVHSEGRAAKSLMEKARAQIAESLGAANADIVFTSGSTEAAALSLAGRGMQCSGVEHDAVSSWCEMDLDADADGKVTVLDPAQTALQLANSETGVVQSLPEGLAVSDLTQGFGKLPFAFEWSGVGMGFVSAHKFGGPRGIGALVFPQGTDVVAQLRGGGQERGWRAGTENLIGIAGFAAAAVAAQQDLAAGVWERVAELRNILEKAIETAAPETIFVGRSAARLPNTSCFVTRGWKGETQVMAMDLAGFAVSAGSACSSGKVKSSRVLRAMGLDEEAAGCAIRVSLGPQTTQEDVLGFAKAWTQRYEKMRTRAA